MRCPTKQPLENSPASVVHRPIWREELPSVELKEDSFELPAGCWGIAIDDSKIQRKLLAKLLHFAGIVHDQVYVTGATADEIHGFGAMVLPFFSSSEKRRLRDVFWVSLPGQSAKSSSRDEVVLSRESAWDLSFLSRRESVGNTYR